MVKLDGGESVSTYAYALAPNSTSLLPKGIDWLPLSPIPLSQSHIRYHEVERGNADFYNSLTQGEYSPTAVVLVNTDNTNNLAAPMNIVGIPVIVVSAQDGKLLQEVLSNSGETKVLCKIYPIAPMAAELNISLHKCKYTCSFGDSPYPFFVSVYGDCFGPAYYLTKLNSLWLHFS